MSSPKSLLAVSIAVLVLTVEAQAIAQTAQVTSPPTWGGLLGGFRPMDPTRSSTRLEMDLSALQGYDEDVDPPTGEGLPIQQFSPNQSGHVTSATGGLRYQLGTDTRYLQASARSSWSYATAGAREMTIGEGTVVAATTLGKRAGLSADASARYQPTFLFNAFGPIEVTPDGTLSGTTPGQGVTEELWRSLAGTARFNRDWTPRQTTEVGYSASQRTPVNGIGFDSRSQAVTIDHVWKARERSGIDFNYRFDENRQAAESGPGRPLQYHTGELGLLFERRRQGFGNAELRIGAGATYSRVPASVLQPAVEFVEPSGSGSLRFDLSHGSSLTADLRRSMTVLEGLSREPFNTDAASINLQGRSFNRLDTTLTAAYSHGHSSVSANSEFETVAAILELRLRASRYVTVYARGNYYRHQLFDVAVLQPGFPSRYELNAVRVGLSFWLPLYGTFRE